MHPWTQADRPLIGVRLFLAHGATSLAHGWRALEETLSITLRRARKQRRDGAPARVRPSDGFRSTGERARRRARFSSPVLLQPGDRPAAAALEDELDPAGVPESRLPSVGALLRQAREASGLEFGQISATLRIRPDHLRAIEAGDYAGLPAPAYAAGFIRSYATHLGLDAAEVVRRFKRESAALSSTPKLAFPEPLRERRVSLGGMTVGFAMVALCAFGAWQIVSADRQDRGEAPAVPAPALVSSAPNVAPPVSAAANTAAAKLEVLSSLSPAAGPPPSSTQALSDSAASHKAEVLQALRPGPSAATAVTGAGPARSAPVHIFGVSGDGPSRIALRATAEAWIEVKDGNTSIFQKLLEPGDEYRMPDKPGLTLHIGNAHGIEVLADGKPLPSAAQPSEGRRTVVTIEARELLAKASAP